MGDLKKKSKKMGMTFIMSSLFLFINFAMPLYAQYKINPYRFVPDSIALKQVDSLLQTLTEREKIAQLVIIEYGSDDTPKNKRMQDYLVSKEKVGGIILMNDVMLAGMKRTNELHKKAAIPLLATLDGEWGVSMRYKEIPPFPRHMQLGALSSDSLVYKAGYLIGKECRLFNFHVNYTPDIDVNNNPNNPVINTRSFGEDRDKVARYGAAIMDGLHAAGVLGSAKHFPGHGDTDVDSHKALPVLSFPFARLHATELYPFRYVIGQNNTDMIMVGHLEVHALDPTGTPASISKPIVTDYLRKGLGYNGIIITDALNMKGVSEYMEKRLIPLAAYKAGVDILLMPEDVENSITEIEKALERGEITAESLDEKVRKVLMMKAKLGLFSDSYNPIVKVGGIEERAIRNENKAFFSKVAKHSMTLVSNEVIAQTGKPVLPITDLKNTKIAYLGYGGENFAKECAEVLMRYAPVDTVILRSPVKNEELIEVKERLLGYDLIILGIHNTDARPQYNFGVDSVHIQMITDWAAEQNMVALFMGNPYILNRVNYKKFKAFVVGYGNTLANNQAAAQLVFGGIPAIGVLPVGAGEFAVGESVVIPKAVRMEYMFHSDDSTYRIKGGKIYGNHILDIKGDTLWHDTRFEVNTDVLNEIYETDLFTVKNMNYLQDIIGSLGMGNTVLYVKGNVQELPDDEPVFVKSTLDDLSKYFMTIMNGGVYGGECIMTEQVRDRFILEIYTIMKKKGGLVIGKNGLNLMVDADEVNLNYEF